MVRKVIVAGGGAAGMAAAIFAAREGAEVTILEGSECCGKKLLATGNGRCNLTNTDPLLTEKYYGTGAEMAKTVISRFDADRTLCFFHEIGLLTQEKNGYVYPYSAQSNAVLKVLQKELHRLKVKIKCREKIEKIEKINGIWEVWTATWCYQGDALVLACGSKAAPSTGSDGSGYQLAKMTGHTIVTPHPALTPVSCVGDFFSKLAGVRCRGKVSLYEKEKIGLRLIKSECGELQWTKYGVSGIVVFQLSRFISERKNTENLFFEIDFMPDFESSYLEQVFEKEKILYEKENAVSLLTGMVHEKLIPVLWKETGIPANVSCISLEKEDIEKIVKVLKSYRIPIKGTKSFDVCQVCAGGVSCEEICQDTMQSQKAGGLFFAGEIVDVDGPCGGYNLQWAWSSGYTAGKAAAREEI